MHQAGEEAVAGADRADRLGFQRRQRVRALGTEQQCAFAAERQRDMLGVAGSDDRCRRVAVEFLSAGLEQKDAAGADGVSQLLA